MCGICGIYSLSGLPVPQPPIERMKSVMKHRGPDDEGTYWSPDIALGHRRLSIIDPEGGHQPLSDETQGTWIVFNGEIYNYRELRQGMVRQSISFRTRSDTEVILKLYLSRGMDFLRSLRGMFSVALWDTHNKKLILARDRMGIKPLYFFQGKNFLVFASEVKALLASGLVPRTLNMKLLKRYVSYGYSSGEETIFEGVRKLSPGTFLAAQGPKVEASTYWRVSRAKVPQTARERREALRNLVEESLRLHLVSDVPLGAFLSGGIDSSVVTGILSRILDRPVKTFTVGFDEKEFDESPFARSVSQAFKTDHHELVVRPNAVELLPRLVSFCDEPFADPSMIPTYLVSQFARDHVKVALSGDGGDELFGGYTRYFKDFREQPFRSIPFSIRRPLAAGLSSVFPPRLRGKAFLKRISLSERDGYLSRLQIFGSEIWKEELRSPCEMEEDRFHLQLYDRSPFSGHRERVFHLDFSTYLPDDVLLKVDRMSMANSLEVRVPLLDHLVAEYALNLPSREKVRGGEGKIILKEAFQDILPGFVFSRGKRGFGIPLARWLRQDLREMVLDHLAPSRVKRRDLFEPAGVSGILSQHMEGKRDHGFRIWTLLVLEIWQQLFVDAMELSPAGAVQSG